MDKWFDGNILPEKQYQGTDVDRVHPLNQLKRDGFSSAVKYDF
jgi:hypothetical protein